MVAATLNPVLDHRVGLTVIMELSEFQGGSALVQLKSKDHLREIIFAEVHEDSKLILTGLRPSQSYEVTTTLTGKDGKEFVLPLMHWQSAALPADLRNMPVFDVQTADPVSMEPGFTILSLRRRPVTRMIWHTPRQRQFLRGYSLLVALDSEGYVVWYYQSDFRISGVHKLSNGNLFFHSVDFRSIEMDFCGDIKRVWYASRRPEGPIEGGISIDADSLHHQPHETPDGNFLCMSANARIFEDYPSSETDPEAPREAKKVVGDRILEFTSEGEVIWEWDAFDHLDPYRIGYDTFSPYWHVRGFPDHVDWSHGNGVTHDHVKGGIIVSLRNQDAFIKIDRDSGDIVWILGPLENWKEPQKSKLLQPVDPNIRWTWHGHNPRVNSDGSFCVYDNGNYQRRPFDPPLRPAESYSRGVEYMVDEKKKVVEQIWTSTNDDSDDKVISWAMGDCHRLPGTGNRLVIDSFCTPEGPALDLQGKISIDDLQWKEWDRSNWHMSDFCYWGRIREYGRANKIVFEVHVRDPDDLVGWEVFGGARIAEL
ncbi:MAG: aryl-sulfate sulfotransferase [Pseudomonadota bacterium]|nr:aryl-sulfate sulfotransferase [Pseudomonadota bacterium]